MSIKRWIYATVTEPLKAKTLIWTKRVRLFTDGGHPIFRWMPRIRAHRYADYYELRGIVMTWLGRQVFLTLGEDKRNLYKKTNRERGLL